MQDSAPQSPQEAAGEPKAAAGHLTPQTVIALPAPSERPVESPKPNGAAPPAKRRGGRPKGSRNPDKLAIRRWMSPKAKKLTLKPFLNGFCVKSRQPRGDMSTRMASCRRSLVT